MHRDFSKNRKYTISEQLLGCTTDLENLQDLARSGLGDVRVVVELAELSLQPEGIYVLGVEPLLGCR